ncbi:MULTISPECIES: enoyl-CoA hydratase/isomerase family protein [Anoxybacillus]|uniref:Ethylmalonyl-CoA decarboxylase n=1 Tax=Anoxybacillus flavithermus TaxID=33934 RepID=A0A178TKD2_9BACL|nr:enoyl-CoA hydratase/isomerase family protein [Anoxybacillus flavithermus]ASA96311.1 enoyl-CoA hydratase/isomerase family protein [Anoxybacillus flavithermus]ELK21404.1 enoyl-CoA hydratase/isomerase [Anoxybacillus flavithermus TNO-09.006]MBE2903973.1 enoyl-CoA hydratase/isomerase family protein [Anoxybacillus flavithermus]MBE2906809.1 enoyl-CoA hydratase/isomerase family protein [Anoxybacillus flavithermus]MBE2909389.1 enoyl-CoA hydratase/isomerase family protein [Anoxybacillus flavithermus]
MRFSYLEGKKNGKANKKDGHAVKGRGKMIEEQHGIVSFTICRPSRRNAIDYAVMDELEQALTLVEQDDEAKVLVITGEGEEAFCAGGDLQVFHQLKTKEEAHAMLAKMGNILYRLLTLSKPTVALINGTAIGGGCELATACDFRFARAGVRLGFVQANLAITTGWGGATMLFEKMPYDQALNILLRAKTMTAEEAEHIGFVHRVFPDSLRERCEKELREYTNKSTAVLRAYKEAAVARWKTEQFRQRFFAEIERCAYLWESEEHDQAVQSFLTKRNK